MEDMKRHLGLGLDNEAFEICKGIVLGLYASRDATGDEFLGWASDFPDEAAGDAVTDWIEAGKPGTNRASFFGNSWTTRSRMAMDLHIDCRNGGLHEALSSKHGGGKGPRTPVLEDSCAHSLFVDIPALHHKLHPLQLSDISNRIPVPQRCPPTCPAQSSPDWPPDREAAPPAFVADCIACIGVIP